MLELVFRSALRFLFKLLEIIILEVAWRIALITPTLMLIPMCVWMIALHQQLQVLFSLKIMCIGDVYPIAQQKHLMLAKTQLFEHVTLFARIRPILLDYMWISLL
jgi:hypothetical protein